MQHVSDEDMAGAELLEQIEQMGDERLAECLSNIESAFPGALPDDVNFSASVVRPSKHTYRTLAPDPIATDNGALAAAHGRHPQPRTLPVQEPLREQDRLLPMANVARLMSCVVPKDAKVARDAKVLMQEMVSEFVCFVTAEANDFSIGANRKAVCPEDCSNALEALDLGMFVPILQDARTHLLKSSSTQVDSIATVPQTLESLKGTCLGPSNDDDSSSCLEQSFHSVSGSSMATLAYQPEPATRSSSSSSLDGTRRPTPIIQPISSTDELSCPHIELLALPAPCCFREDHGATLPSQGVVVAKVVPEGTSSAPTAHIYASPVLVGVTTAQASSTPPFTHKSCTVDEIKLQARRAIESSARAMSNFKRVIKAKSLPTAI